MIAYFCTKPYFWGHKCLFTFAISESMPLKPIEMSQSLAGLYTIIPCYNYTFVKHHHNVDL
jgi:hypothetical protein